MHDRRDYVIAALAALLLLSVGVLFGRHTASVLPAAEAQEAPSGGAFPAAGPNGTPTPGVTVTQDPLENLKSRGSTSSPTASDSDSNNRFVAVTSPIGSGESVLFLVDAKKEQIAIYKFDRGKGLKFLAARKIDYDLMIDGYQDMSEFTRGELRQEYHKQVSDEAASAAKKKR